jgi:hypothetical protein
VFFAVVFNFAQSGHFFAAETSYGAAILKSFLKSSPAEKAEIF